MNRWSRWARRLRSLHGRVETCRPAATMLFHRPSLTWASFAMHAGARIQVHVHAPMGIALRPVTSAPAMVHTQPVQVFVPKRNFREGRSNSMVRTSLSPAPQPVLMTKFVNAYSIANTRINTIERTWHPVRELVTAWLRKSPVSAAAQALPLRLRQSALRTERPVKDLPRMITPVRRDSARQAPSALVGNGQTAPPWTTALPNPQPTPAAD